MNKFHKDSYYDLDINMYDWVSNNKMLFVQAILESNKGLVNAFKLIMLMRAREQWLARDSLWFVSHYDGSPLARYKALLDVILIDSHGNSILCNSSNFQNEHYKQQ